MLLTHSVLWLSAREYSFLPQQTVESFEYRSELAVVITAATGQTQADTEKAKVKRSKVNDFPGTEVSPSPG